MERSCQIQENQIFRTKKSFENYYKKLFSSNENESNQDHQLIENQTNEFYENIKEEYYHYNVTEFEINTAIKNLKLNKSVGYDDIPAEMIIYSSLSFKKVLRYFFSLIFSYGYIPNDLNVAIVSPIPKS